MTFRFDDSFPSPLNWLAVYPVNWFPIQNWVVFLSEQLTSRSIKWTQIITYKLSRGFFHFFNEDWAPCWRALSMTWWTEFTSSGVYAPVLVQSILSLLQLGRGNRRPCHHATSYARPTYSTCRCTYIGQCIKRAIPLPVTRADLKVTPDTLDPSLTILSADFSANDPQCWSTKQKRPFL